MRARNGVVPSEVIVDRLEEKIRGYYAARLAELGHVVSDDLPLQGTLRVYLNWLARQVPAQPRALLISPELALSAKAAEHRMLLAELVAKIAAGAPGAHRNHHPQLAGRRHLLRHLGSRTDDQLH